MKKNAHSNQTASILASIVFLKIQEFARKSAQEQARLRAQLEAVIAVTAAEIAEENRVVLDASDGAAIVVLCDPRGALRLAERSLLAVAGGLPLCIGVNHGTVQLIGSLNSEGMIGDGIAVAASIAEFASTSRLLISRSFRDALADAAPGWDAHFPAAETFTDAGLRTHELFSPDKNAVTRRRRRFLALGVLAVIGFIGAGIAMRISMHGYENTLADARIQWQRVADGSKTHLRRLIEAIKF